MDEQEQVTGSSQESPLDGAIDRAIQAWLVGYIHNSEVSASGVYNHLARTLPALKACLQAELLMEN